MSYQAPWHKIVPILAPTAQSCALAQGTSALDISALDQPVVANVDWTRPGLNARIAYQMGEADTAQVIIKNALAEIDCWLPSSLKLFAILLYEARLAFFGGELEDAICTYEYAMDLMAQHQIERDYPSTAADLYDELGDCLMLLGLEDEALPFYSIAASIDLACYEINPMQLSTFRLAKLADFLGNHRAPATARHCLELAQSKCASPVEMMFLRSCSSFCN